MAANCFFSHLRSEQRKHRLRFSSDLPPPFQRDGVPRRSGIRSPRACPLRCACGIRARTPQAWRALRTATADEFPAGKPGLSGWCRLASSGWQARGSDHGGQSRRGICGCRNRGAVGVVECHSLTTAAMPVMMAAASFGMALSPPCSSMRRLRAHACCGGRGWRRAGVDAGALRFDSHKRSFLVRASCTEAPCVTRYNNQFPN